MDKIIILLREHSLKPIYYRENLLNTVNTKKLITVPHWMQLDLLLILGKFAF